MSEQKLSELIPKNKPFTFEALDARPGFRASDSGAHTYSVNFMVTEEMWNSIKTIPRHRLIYGMLAWMDDQAEPESKAITEAVQEEVAQSAASPEKPARKEKAVKERGDWSAFWTEMFKVRQFYYDRDLWHVLSLENGDSVQVRATLHVIFAVSSLTFVSPETFIEWAMANQLQRLAGVAEEVALHTKGAQEKAE